jgi:hypothetical protein
MVDLPPSLEDLNDYARFSFVHEMHTMAAQVAPWIGDNSSLSGRIKIALVLLEEELHELQHAFATPYVRPPSEHSVALILRCAELYLDVGTWFTICHGDTRLRGKDTDASKDEIRTVFHDAEVTNRFVIQSPIIELTLTRFELMSFFKTQNELFATEPTLYEIDPGNDYHLTGVSPFPCEASLMNSAEFNTEEREIESVLLSDEEYLQKREEVAWAVYRDFRWLGSIFCVLYFFIFTVIAFDELINSGREYPLAAAVATGYCLLMLLAEIGSIRICHIACLRPQNTIPFFYPGIEFYLIQYAAVWIGAIIVLIAVFADFDKAGTGLILFAFHQIIAIIAPLFCCLCFFRKHKRVDREFRWIRTGFFDSAAWIVVKVIFLVFLTPGVYGIQMLLANNLRNHAKVSSGPHQTLLVAP